MVFLKDCGWQPPPPLFILTKYLLGNNFLPAVLAILFLKFLGETLPDSVLSIITSSN